MDIKKIALILSGFMFSVVAYSEGLSGIPSSVSGQKRVEGNSIKELSDSTNNVSSYIKERVKPEPLRFVRPASDSRDSSADAGVDNDPSYADEQNSLNEAGDEADLVSSSFTQASSIEYVLPDGYKEVTLRDGGNGVIDGDKSGTYVIRVPPLLYSVFSLPFKPEFRTPFPNFVTVDVNDGVVMVAAKENIPVNLVFFHPDQPSLSVSVFLIPDVEKIPANVNVVFSKSKIPESEREKEKSGVVVDGHNIARIRKKNLASISQYEKGTVHSEMLKKINIDVANGFMPEGYELNQVTEGPIGVLCGDRRLVGRYVQNMIGEQFEVDVFEIKNAGNDYVEFKESSCYRSGVASIQFNPSPLLKPGSTAELVIVHSKTITDNTDRVRRPTKVQGGAYAK